jgi:uncharacterized protein YaiL (DUF2058 family)
MSMSLREQLLQAGLVNERQAREAERQLQQQQQSRQQQPKSRRAETSAGERSAQQSAVAKAARDQQLNRRQQEQAERRARHAQIKQLIDQHRLPAVASDEYYSFVDDGRIRRIAADAATRARIISGEIAIVRCEGRHELVSAAAAARIAEREPHAVLARAEIPQRPAAEADYAGFEVPDDLLW